MIHQRKIRSWSVLIWVLVFLSVALREAAALGILVDAVKTTVINNASNKIFTVTVRSLEESQTLSGPLKVLYYLDDRFEEEYTVDVLPFSFQRNLAGQLSGVHTIRIDIEDGGENVLARQTTEVIVP
jgi:hypothetical protein